jgi:preprotein translocase subunit SecE
MASGSVRSTRERRTSLPTFYRQVVAELRKVVWPTRQETMQTTLVIIVVVIVLSLLLGLIDLFLKWSILDTLLKLGR